MITSIKQRNIENFLKYRRLHQETTGHTGHLPISRQKLIVLYSMFRTKAS